MADNTHKDAETLEQRIYYTLTMDDDCEQINDDLKLHRLAKAVSCLAMELKVKGVLDDASIESWLQEISP